MNESQFWEAYKSHAEGSGFGKKIGHYLGAEEAKLKLEKAKVNNKIPHNYGINVELPTCQPREQLHFDQEEDVVWMRGQGAWGASCWSPEQGGKEKGNEELCHR